MIMDPALEIRKLRPSHVQELTVILETHELWKRLMSIIPKNLQRFNYTCDVSVANPHKYNSEHFRIIENASLKTKRACTEILLDEWGTSGRVLPTIGHLLYLLTKARLFRAADYVAVSMLNQPKPKRPKQGPEASILINLPDTKKANINLKEEEIEKLLNEIDYPASAVQRILSLNLQDAPKQRKPAIPKIVITANCEDEIQNTLNYKVPCVKTKELKTERNISESDMIKFSTDSVKSQVISKTVHESTSENSGINISDLNQIPVFSNESGSGNHSTMGKIPEISKLLNSESNTNLPDISLINNSSEISSNFSQEILISTENCAPAISDLLDDHNVPISHENIPNISALGHSLTENASAAFTVNIPDLSALQLTQCDSIVQNILNNISSNEINVIESDNPPFSANKTNNSECILQEQFTNKLYSAASSFNLPDFNALNSTTFQPNSIENIDEIISSSSISDIRNFTALHSNSSGSDWADKIINEVASGSVISADNPDIGDLKLAKSRHDSKEKLSTKLSSSLECVLPDLSAIQTLSTRSKTVSVNVSSSDSNSRPCNSPLPQLSLNTQLPNFNYTDLIMATNNFNKELYIDESANGRFLGSGAFGSVFLAFGLLDKPVAVKKLVLENVDYVDVDATVTKQFKNEVEVLSHYKHPNLLALVGYSCDGCTYCLLYEYIQGGALSVRLQPKTYKLLWKERLKIALGTASAVAYLHTAFSTPLIHRDIKSANILLDCSNTPKLCDFGLIKLSPSQNTATATTVFGTSAYMAPEAFRGDISVKMDTFSFGVVLLELLTSLPPVDENREGTDLVTHVGENCEEDSITPLLDQGAGTWTENDVCYDAEIYKIAMMCLEEKKKRPNMVSVRDLLHKLTKKLFV